MSAQDELTASICLAVRQLTQIKKAGILLNIVLALIEDGQYGDEVKGYLDLCLRTPDLPKEDTEKALLVQRNVQKLGGGQLQLREVRNELPHKEIHVSMDPACQRIPPEIWDQIATQTPKYHLRTWLFLSSLHREIASRHIFHTIDMYFLGSVYFNRGLDILDYAPADPVFASHIKSLRLHWEYYDWEIDMVEVLFRILKISLPALKALRHFEWIGTPEMPSWMVQILFKTHKHLHGLGLIGWHFDAVAVSPFYNLRKFTCCVNDDFKAPNWGAIRTALNLNENTLKHLVLGRHSCVIDSLDLVFESVTINNLTHLDLWGTYVSNFLIDRIAHAHNLQSLTVHGWFVDPNFASGIFATDRIIDGTNTLLPHLESFRFLMELEDEALNHSVIHCIRKRKKLRRLDLGRCPWDMVQDILPDLMNLRVLAVYIDELSQQMIKSLVEAIPTQMVAIGLSVKLQVLDTALDEYAHFFTCFNTLSFLHLTLPFDPMKPDQIDKSLCSIAAAVPSLDFLAYDDKLFVIERSHGDTGPTVELKELSTRSNLEYGSGVDIVSDDIAWLRQGDMAMEWEDG